MITIKEFILCFSVALIIGFLICLWAKWYVKQPLNCEKKGWFYE